MPLDGELGMPRLATAWHAWLRSRRRQHAVSVLLPTSTATSAAVSAPIATRRLAEGLLFLRPWRDGRRHGAIASRRKA